jgi:CHASE2 domain-containing sensor protein
MIEALVECRAKAIAIDIDFSPRIDARNPLQTGLRSEKDPKFFEFLHEQGKKGVPVFVGAYNIGAESKTWLGTESNKDLAADMTLFDKGSNSTEVRAWLQCPNSTKLNNISKALAEASGLRPQPPRWLSPLLVDDEAQENLRQTVKNDRSNNPVLCQRAYTLVNYSKLELIQKLALQTLDRNSILAARNTKGQSRFQDKLVIIGNGQRDKAADSFNIIGRDDPNASVFGIFIHAVATYTLTTDPVYRFKHWVTILLDSFLGAIVVIGLFVVGRRRGTDSRFSPHLRESIFILISILAVLSLGFIMVKIYNVLWLDFSLVILALLLHSKVHNGLAYFLRKLFKSENRVKNDVLS